MTVPGLMTPGQRTRQGTRQPPSQLVSFSPRNGVVPPSGQLITSAPLSVEYMTMVLSAMPSSSSLVEQLADVAVVLDHAVGIDAQPGLALATSFFRCVKMCMRVEFHQTKKGLSSLTALLDELERRVGELLVDRLHALLVSGPVSSIVCLPTGP